MPLNTDTFSTLMDSFCPFEAQPHLAVALSGGADSMALVILANHWATERGGKVTALIIDHRLRDASTREAQQVAEWLPPLGIDSCVMVWEGDKPGTRIQEMAREKRYEFLEGWCREHQILHLLTAHHGDDQWETVMQRLSRQSGEQGLRGIQGEVMRPFGRIIRPFLTVSKNDILQFLTRRQQPFITDPSNENEIFERVRWRKDRLIWESKGFNQDKILAIIRESTQTCAMNEATLQIWIMHHLTLSEYGYITLNRDGWEKLIYSLKLLLLKKIISAMGRQKYPTPTSTIEHILSGLINYGAINGGGCYFVNRSHAIIIVRETRNLPRVYIDKPVMAWDCFVLTFHDSWFNGLYIEAVGQKRAEHLAAKLQLPSYVVAALPCTVMGQEVHIFHDGNDNLNDVHIQLTFSKPLS